MVGSGRGAAQLLSIILVVAASAANPNHRAAWQASLRNIAPVLALGSGSWQARKTAFQITARSLLIYLQIRLKQLLCDFQLVTKPFQVVVHLVNEFLPGLRVSVRRVHYGICRPKMDALLVETFHEVANVLLE